MRTLTAWTDAVVSTVTGTPRCLPLQPLIQFVTHLPGALFAAGPRRAKAGGVRHSMEAGCVASSLAPPMDYAQSALGWNEKTICSSLLTPCALLTIATDGTLLVAAIGRRLCIYDPADGTIVRQDVGKYGQALCATCCAVPSISTLHTVHYTRYKKQHSSAKHTRY